MLNGKALPYAVARGTTRHEAETYTVKADRLRFIVS